MQMTGVPSPWLPPELDEGTRYEFRNNPLAISYGLGLQTGTLALTRTHALWRSGALLDKTRRQLQPTSEQHDSEAVQDPPSLVFP